MASYATLTRPPSNPAPVATAKRPVALRRPLVVRPSDESHADEVANQITRVAAHHPTAGGGRHEEALSGLKTAATEVLKVPLAGVNVHTGSFAQRLNHGMGARALTFGDHIFFARGEYRPETSAGAGLVAHELAHVAQQRTAGRTLQPKFRIGAFPLPLSSKGLDALQTLGVEKEVMDVIREMNESQDSHSLTSLVAILSNRSDAGFRAGLVETVEAIRTKKKGQGLNLASGLEPEFKPTLVTDRVTIPDQRPTSKVEGHVVNRYDYKEDTVFGDRPKIDEILVNPNTKLPGEVHDSIVAKEKESQAILDNMTPPLKDTYAEPGLGFWERPMRFLFGKPKEVGYPEDGRGEVQSTFLSHDFLERMDQAAIEGVATIGGVMGIGGRSATRPPPLRLPRIQKQDWQWGKIRPIGSTDRYGRITIQQGLKGREFRETLRHERVHRFLSPAPGGAFQAARANFRLWGYNNLHLLRYMEEGIAEGYATRSFRKGIQYPMKGYRINPLRLKIEATIYGMIVVGPTAAAAAVSTMRSEE